MKGIVLAVGVALAALGPIGAASAQQPCYPVVYTPACTTYSGAYYYPAAACPTVTYPTCSYYTYPTYRYVTYRSYPVYSTCGYRTVTYRYCR
jgi:hypothetical protein